MSEDLTCPACGGALTDEYYDTKAVHLANLSCIAHLRQRIEALEKERGRLWRQIGSIEKAIYYLAGATNNLAEEFWDIFMEAANAPDDLRGKLEAHAERRRYEDEGTGTDPESR